jgi:hypothetical protein
VPLNFKTWYEKSGSWDNLLPPICNLGKVCMLLTLFFHVSFGNLIDSSYSKFL